MADSETEECFMRAMNRFVTLLAAGLSLQVGDAVALRQPKYTFSEVTCAHGARALPPQPSVAAGVLIVDAARGLYRLTVDWFGDLGGDCRAEVRGAFTTVGNAFELIPDELLDSGSFRSPCRDLVDVFQGHFQIRMESREGAEIMGEGGTPRCASPRIRLRVDRASGSVL